MNAAMAARARLDTSVCLTLGGDVSAELSGGGLLGPVVLSLSCHAGQVRLAVQPGGGTPSMAEVDAAERIADAVLVLRDVLRESYRQALTSRLGQ